MIVDHQRLVTDREYFKKIRRRCAKRCSTPGFSWLTVLHEENGSCCATQPWKTSAAHLFGPVIAPMLGREADDVTAILSEHQPEITIVSRASLEK